MNVSFRRSVVIFLFLTLNLFSIIPMDLSEFSLGISAGILLDVAPYGIENKYLSVGVEVNTPQGWFSLCPALYLSQGIRILRLPVYFNLILPSADSEDQWAELWKLGFFAGAGLEYYSDNEHKNWSPVISGGIRVFINSFTLTIPACMAFRGYNTDSDIGLTIGYQF